VAEICKINNLEYLIALEYYGFNLNDTSFFSDDCLWTRSLQVSRLLIWRIYRQDGELMDQKVDADTLFWVSNICSDVRIPEITDAVREVFFLAGEKYAKRISPYWTSLSRSYFLVIHGGNDISLDRDHLMLLKSGKKSMRAFKACYNLAVLSESEDKLQEAIMFLGEAKAIKKSDSVDYYIEKLQRRLDSRKALDLQSGFN
jgi:hypothetical protein